MKLVFPGDGHGAESEYNLGPAAVDFFRRFQEHQENDGEPPPMVYSVPPNEREAFATALAWVSLHKNDNVPDLRDAGGTAHSTIPYCCVPMFSGDRELLGGLSQDRLTAVLNHAARFDCKPLMVTVARMIGEKYVANMDAAEVREYFGKTDPDDMLTATELEETPPPYCVVGEASLV